MFLCGKNQLGLICHIGHINHIVFKMEQKKKNAIRRITKLTEIKNLIIILSFISPSTYPKAK